jgi:hypothetical protein
MEEVALVAAYCELEVEELERERLEREKTKAPAVQARPSRGAYTTHTTTTYVARKRK